MSPWKRFAAIVPLLLAALGAPAQGASPRGLTVYYYERMPYYGEIDGRVSGFLAEIARLVLDDAGIPYTFEDAPATRVLENLKLPGDACALGWFRTPQREAIYAYSREAMYRDEPFWAIIDASKARLLPPRPAVEDILRSGWRLGLIEGYVYGPWLDEKIGVHAPESEIVNIRNDSEIMYRMLANGRFDYMFASREESLFIIGHLGAEIGRRLALVELADAPAGNPRYFILSKGVDGAMLARIDASLARIKRGEAYSRIVQGAKDR
jgi:polar amino acid transport system substrate-binding protein